MGTKGTRASLCKETRGLGKGYLFGAELKLPLQRKRTPCGSAVPAMHTNVAKSACVRANDPGSETPQLHLAVATKVVCAHAHS